MKTDQAKVSALILDTLTSLCKNGLAFANTLRIQGLIGVTSDDKEVFIIQIDEHVASAYAKQPADHATSNVLSFHESSQVSKENSSVQVGRTEPSFHNSKTRKRSLNKKPKCTGEWKSNDHRLVDQLDEGVSLLTEEGREDCMCGDKSYDRTSNSFVTNSCSESEMESHQQQVIMQRIQNNKLSTSDMKNEGCSAGWFDCNMNVSCSTKWIDEFVKMHNQKGDGGGFGPDVQGFGSSASYNYLGNLESMETGKVDLHRPPTTCFQDAASSVAPSSPTSSAPRSNGYPMYRCPYEQCGFTFLYKRSSDRHQRTKHGSIYGATDQTTYVCPHGDCGKVFYKPNSFARHLNCAHLKKSRTERGKPRRWTDSPSRESK